MELRQLQLLQQVIAAGGFAPAGKALHLSHSAIHRQIRILEAELDCRLLVRSGRNVAATEAGLLLADLASRVHQEISQLQSQVSDLSNLRRGSLRIGTSSSILVSFLPAVLERYSRRFPGVSLRIATGIADDLIEDVLAGKLDVAIVFNPTDLPHSHLRLVPEVLYREEFDWAVGRGHPLAARNQVTLPELAAYPLITTPPRSHLRRACDRLFASRGLVLNVITELENEEAIDKLTELNMGFALRSRRRPPDSRIRCFRIPDRTIRCEVGFVLPRKTYRSRALAEFLHMCREMKMPAHA